TLAWRASCPRAVHTVPAARVDALCLPRAAARATNRTTAPTDGTPRTLRTFCLRARAGIAMGCDCHHRRTRIAGLLRRSQSRPARAARTSSGHAAVTLTGGAAGLCGPHDTAHVRRHGAVAAVHFRVWHLGRQEPARRAHPGADSRHPAVRADPRLPVRHRGVLPLAGARTRARCGGCG